jgi:AraC-like DNA-binding protein
VSGGHDSASGTLAAAAEAGAASHPADPLSDVLEAVRLTGALFFVVEAAPPWVAEAPPASLLAPAILPRTQHVVSYHVIVEGRCFCRVDGEPPLALSAGDVLVVPHGDAYALASAPKAKGGPSQDEVLAWFRAMASGRLPAVVEEGGGGSRELRVVCGFLGCDALPFNPVLSALPRLVRVSRDREAPPDRLGGLVDFVLAESRDGRKGARAVLRRVGELMFVEVLRRHLASAEAPDAGWLAGLRDPLVGRALERLHAEPARDWTLDDLARAVAASRSVLSERFALLVGEPPMHYLTRWRIQRAARLLGEGARKVSSVAAEVGYESEAAFSRAFKKLAGESPAAYRDRLRRAT